MRCISNGDIAEPPNHPIGTAPVHCLKLHNITNKLAVNNYYHFYRAMLC